MNFMQKIQSLNHMYAFQNFYESDIPDPLLVLWYRMIDIIIHTNNKKLFMYIA